MRIFVALIGLVIVIISIYMGHVYWFSDEVKEGSGIPAMTFMFTGVPVGLFLIFKKKVDKAKAGYLIPIGGMIGIFIFSYIYHSYLKDAKLKNEGVETYGVVTFNELVGRGSSRDKEIRYTYKVDGITYNKYATNEEYIINNHIKVNDTIVITYWKSNPHYHDYRVK